MKVQAASRRSKERQRELSDLKKRARARVFAPALDPPPTSEEVFKARLWSSRIFSKIPRCCFPRARKEYFRFMSLFSASTPDETEEYFLDDSDQSCSEHYLAFLRIFFYIQTVFRRFYSGAEGSGDAQADTLALEARVDIVLGNINAVFDLWWSAEDAVCVQTQSSARALWLLPPPSRPNVFDRRKIDRD